MGDSKCLLLDILPTELLTEVLSQVTNVADILNLCLVSKSLNALATPQLFRVAPVVITAPRRFELLSSFLKEYPPSRTGLRGARRLDVRPDVPRQRERRCYHYANLDVSDEPHDDASDPERIIDAAEDTKADKIASLLLPHLEVVKDGNLDHFGWDMATCIPADILGPDGWLPRRHKNIQSLRLMLSGPNFCSSPESRPRTAISLRDFKQLKSLSLRSLTLPLQFEETAFALVQNADHLEHLELTYTERFRDFSLGSFAEHILKLRPADHHRPFELKALRELLISCINFGTTNWSELRDVFNWERLSSLTIRKCEFAGSFLHSLVESNTSLRLKTLDFCSLHSHVERDGKLERFLGSFNGLENVYLHLESEYSFSPHDYFHSSTTRDYFGTLAEHHGATLKSLIFEIRLWRRTGEREWPGDHNDMGLGGIDGMSEFRRDNPLLQLRKLECLGLGARPDILEIILAPLNKKSAIKILHVRVPPPFRPNSTYDEDVYSADVNRGDAGFWVNRSNGEDAFWAYRAGKRSSIDTATYCATHPNTFFKFANWVFSEAGIASLELLVYGDCNNGAGSTHEPLFIKRRTELSDDPKTPQWDFYPRWGGERVLPLDELLNKHEDFLKSTSMWN